jgi:hypothetical protein
MREHIEPLARRGDRDALQLLTGPPFPRTLGYLMERYAEFTLWHDCSRSPTWADWHAFGVLMGYRLTPFDLRSLRRIHDAHRKSAAPVSEAKA